MKSPIWILKSWHFINAKGKGRFADPKQIAEAVRRLQKFVPSSKTVNDSVNQVLAISKTSIRALSDQIKAL
jgi:hypothetical protein